MSIRSPEPAAAGRPHDVRRPDESKLRVICVSAQASLVADLEGVFAKAVDCAFALDWVADPAILEAAIASREWDLAVLDLGRLGRRRAEAADLAGELALRLPVVVLTGTEAYDARVTPADRSLLRARLEDAGLPAVLVRTLRRARRLGGAVIPPVFCRLDHPGD